MGARKSGKKKAARKQAKAKKKNLPKRGKKTPPKGGKKDPRGILPFGMKRPTRPRGAPRVSEVQWRPPTANGHFDRLFFSLCSHHHELLRIDGYVQSGPTQIPFTHGPNSPMSISEIMVPTAQTQFIHVVATLLDLPTGVVEHREYIVDLLAHTSNVHELIECLVVGLAVHDLNGAPNPRPFGTIFYGDVAATSSGSYGLLDSHMIKYP